MLVLVTGGTGFVGSHVVAELVRRGHRARILARSPAGVAAAPPPLAGAEVEWVHGDVREPTDVAEALRGCDAVVHAAAVYALGTPFRLGRARVMKATAARGTEVVVGAARRLGLDPIVHLSTLTALRPGDDRVVTPDSPVVRARSPYRGSKAAAELVARRHQDGGAPVVITYPGMVWGPDDPRLGVSSRLALQLLGGRLPLPPGGIPVVDVRDVAAAHAALLEPGRGPRRYVLGGTFLRLEEIAETVARAAGRPLRGARLPPPLARVLGGLHEGLAIMAEEARCDDSLAERELGFAPRDARRTLEDTVRWLVAAGHAEPHPRTPRAA